MSKTVQISSTNQFNKLLETSKIVVADCTRSSFQIAHLLRREQSKFFFLQLMDSGISTDISPIVYADWCGPCKTIAPLYEQFSAKLSRPNKITFVNVDTEKQQEHARTYSVTGYISVIPRVLLGVAVG